MAAKRGAKRRVVSKRKAERAMEEVSGMLRANLRALLHYPCRYSESDLLYKVALKQVLLFSVRLSHELACLLMEATGEDIANNGLNNVSKQIYECVDDFFEYEVVPHGPQLRVDVKGFSFPQGGIGNA